MAHETAGKPKTLSLSLSPTVAGPVDVGHLIRELEVIDETLLQMNLRSTGEKQVIPTTTRLLDEIVEINGIDLLKQEDRDRLKQFLTQVKEQSPVLHISFSADPSRDFLAKLMTWLRQEIHPSILLTIGLQPNIGAGCIVRSTNKQFDLSLRQDFLEKRDLLLKQLAAPTVEPVPEPKEQPA